VTAFDYVANDQQLAECCLALQDCSLLAVDTEFVRERTFYPQPGLIQVSDGHNISLIDPNACSNLQPFFKLLETPKIQIVMHSSSEDIELFYFMGCGTITNLFDTQVACSWLGFGQSLSLQNMVERYENIVIEKQLSRTDWLKRPLSDAQLEYAAIDVLYLCSICKQQQKLLKESKFLKFMIEDCDLRCERKTLPENDKWAYLKVKKAISATTDAALSRLQQIAAWREQRARSDDKPRQHVLKDLQLLSISIENPKTLQQLANKCDLPPFIIRRYGDDVLGVITDASEDDTPTHPVLSLRALPEGGKTLNDCRALMVDINLQQHIPREVLPSKRWLEQYLLHQAANWYPEPEGWKDWRKELLEEPLNKLIKQNNFKISQAGTVV